LLSNRNEMALSKMNLEVKPVNRRRSSILFSKLSDAGLSDVLSGSLIDTSQFQVDESQNVEQTLSDLDFYYGLGKLIVYISKWKQWWIILNGITYNCKIYFIDVIEKVQI
jgi:hypothetical protein